MCLFLRRNTIIKKKHISYNPLLTFLVTAWRLYFHFIIASFQTFFKSLLYNDLITLKPIEAKDVGFHPALPSTVQHQYSVITVLVESELSISNFKHASSTQFNLSTYVHLQLKE